MNKYLIKIVRSRGFTLVELLVVISIIGLIAATTLVGLRSVRGKARDVQVKADVNSIGAALESYASEHNETYPSTGGLDDPLDGGTSYTALIPRAYAATYPICTGLGGVNDVSPVACTLLTGNYLNKIPKNRAYGDEPYVYNSSDGKSYTLKGKLASDPTKLYVFEHQDGKDSYDVDIKPAPSDITNPIWAAGDANLYYTNSGNDVTFHWSPAQDDSGSLKYNILYYKGEGDGYQQLSTPDIPGSSTSYTMHVENTWYEFWLKATDPAGNYIESNHAGGNWDPAMADTVPPTVPGSMNIISFLHGVNCSWGQSADMEGNGEWWASGVAGYVLEWKKTTDSWSTLAGYRFVDTSHIIIDPFIGGNYNFRVKAVDYNGNNSAYRNYTDWNNSLQSVVVPEDVPYWESGTEASLVDNGNNNYTVSWPAATLGSPVDHYDVRYVYLLNGNWLVNNLTNPSNPLENAKFYDSNRTAQFTAPDGAVIGSVEIHALNVNGNYGAIVWGEYF